MGVLLSSVKLPQVSIQPSFLVPPRIDNAELLETGIGSDEDVKANFADMWRINRFLGGLPALTQHLYPRLLAHEGTATVVDLGAGSGDMAAAIRHWAHEHHIDLNLWGLDFSARNLALTRRASDTPYETRLQADALHLPFQAGQVDYFISSLFLHHFAPETLKKMLANTVRAANKGIIMSDLTRGLLPQVAFKLGQPIFARNYLTRHDGMVSIRRAYMPDELLYLAQMAGLTKARVYCHWGWRMTLVADK